MAGSKTVGWDEWLARTDPKTVRRRINAVFPKALGRVGKVFEADAKQGIAGGIYAPNAPLTVALKKSSLPLVDKSNLVGAITSQVRGLELRVGVNSPRLGSGRLLYEVLHNGATIQVTAAMRRAVMAKLGEAMRSGQGGAGMADWLADAHSALAGFSGGATATWVIPPRPFLATVWEDPAFARKVKAILTQAMEAIVRGPRT